MKFGKRKWCSHTYPHASVELQSFIDSHDGSNSQEMAVLKSLKAQLQSTEFAANGQRDLEELLRYMHEIAEQESH